MRFNISIYADSSEELKEALLAAAAALPASIAGFPAKAGFTISVTPDAFSGAPALGQAQAQAPATPTAKPAGATTTRKAAPPKETAPAAEVKTEPKADPVAVATTAKALTPKEAKEAALDILRDCFAIEKTPGDGYGAKAVKALQADLGVDKFIKVPDERGQELLDKAQKLKAELTGSATQDASEDPFGGSDDAVPAGEEGESESVGEEELAY